MIIEVAFSPLGNDYLSEVFAKPHKDITINWANLKKFIENILEEDQEEICWQ